MKTNERMNFAEKTGLTAKDHRIVFSKQLKREIAAAISECEHDRIFVLTDTNTERHCWQVMKDFFSLRGFHKIVVKAGDTNKNIESLAHIWNELSNNGATRHSLLINLGGGMVSDLGGFAAATFKRGINFINIPTTLLAMVDASVGGKTGINFNGLKNEVGVFCEPRFVIIDSCFLQTLDHESLLSGYAEMLKHGLISNEKTWAAHLNFDLNEMDFSLLSDMIEKSVKTKQRIVLKDLKETGIRKSLNLGHTVGHAIETWASSRKPIPHGFAVVYGLICELYLSCHKTGFPIEKMRQTVSFIRQNYSQCTVTCDDYETLYELMTHDKKNIGSTIRLTLLANIGEVCIDQSVTEDEIEEALDFLRESF